MVDCRLNRNRNKPICKTTRKLIPWSLTDDKRKAENTAKELTREGHKVNVQRYKGKKGPNFKYGVYIRD